MKYEGIVIADIHFGAIRIEEFIHELKHSFVRYIEDMKKIDFLIIDGDYFDRKLYANEKVIEYSIIFMDALCKLSKEKNFPIRIVYGTESHEANQYSLFSKYEDDYNFRVIKTVTDEELLPDLNVLYLPEEYMTDKKDFYESYLDKEKYYNYIFGHGIINEVMTYVKRGSNNKSDRVKVPVFTSKELEYACKGNVYFGHYHINSSIDDRVFYVGSFSRWIHGEDSPKGFYHIKCDTSKNTYTHEFIENNLAQKYITIKFSSDDPILFSNNIMEELSKKDEFVQMNNIDHVKYVFDIPENYPNTEYLVNILTERYKDNKSIKVETNKKSKGKSNEEKIKDISELEEEFPLIFDKSSKYEDKIIYYIKKKENRDISMEIVKRIVYKE